ncbi:MAG: PIG-L deacetylase family protein [Caldilineaceae bacterium]
MSNSFYVPERAMAIAAHPDDIEFGSAGTLARWVKEGCEVAYVLVTSGDVGIADPGMTKARATEIRETETLAAAKVVGVTDVTFLRVGDGMVENTMELRKRLVREIRRFKPEVIVGLDPTLMFTPMGGINHPDHRAVGEATMDAVFPACGQPNLFQELEEEGIYAHKVRKVYVSARGHGDTFVDISSTIDLKIEALKAHDSQVGKADGLAERIRERSAVIGQGKEMAYAEAFRVLTIENDETWARLKALEKETAAA